MSEKLLTSNDLFGPISSNSTRLHVANVLHETREIYNDESQATITLRNIHLNSNRPSIRAGRVIFEKQPLEVKIGERYYFDNVTLDDGLAKLTRLSNDAKALRAFSQDVRPRMIVDLVRRYIHYAYDDVIKKLSMTDSKRACWIEQNTGLGATARHVPLSEVFKHGYGVCYHMAIATLWVSHLAGMSGTLLHADLGVIKNVSRLDTGHRLFSIEEAIAHVWLELQNSKEDWIQVDPATYLIGDNDTERSTFSAANYQASAMMNITHTTDTKGLVVQTSGSSFAPGAQKMAVNYGIALPDLGNQASEMQSFDGDVTIKVCTEPKMRLMNVRIVEVE